MGERAADIVITDFALSHVAEAAQIEHRLFRDPWDGAAFVNVARQGPYRAWVALEQGCVVGYLVTQWILDEVHILNIAVIERARPKRVAAALMDRLFEQSAKAGMRHFFLEVRLSNLPAQSLYYRYGFARLSIRKGYYRDGEDAVVMYRCLELPDRSAT